MSRRVIRTKIVCTLGSSGDRTSVGTIAQLLQAGMDVARVNMSHSTSYATTGSYVRGETYEADRWRMTSIRQASKETGIPVAILGDLQGPKVRCGTMAEGKSVELHRGQRFLFWRDPARLGTSAGVSLQYFDQVLSQVAALTNVWLSDGLIQLTVSEIDTRDEVIVMQVEAGGFLGSYQGVIFKDLSLDLPQMTPKDEADLAFLCDQDIDFIALSYLRGPDDVAQVRARMTRSLPIIAKIETAEALANLDALLAVVDGAMVARGDLGARLPFSEIALVQKTIIERCNVLGLPVITATQMLDSMETRPVPTRAEVTDVANAILDGTDALMLSGETAKGAYPLEAIRTLVTIAARIEGTGGPFDHAGVASGTEEPLWAPVLRDPAYRLTFKERNFKLEAAIAKLKITGGYPVQENRAVADSIARAASDVAQALGVRCILCPTSSGTTPRLVGRFRPAAWIIGAVENEATARRLLLSYGILPLVMQAPVDASAEDLLRAARDGAIAAGLLQPGELFLFTAGYPVREPGSTNLLKVHRA